MSWIYLLIGFGLGVGASLVWFGSEKKEPIERIDQPILAQCAYKVADVYAEIFVSDQEIAEEYPQRVAQQVSDSIKQELMNEIWKYAHVEMVDSRKLFGTTYRAWVHVVDKGYVNPFARRVP